MNKNAQKEIQKKEDFKNKSYWMTTRDYEPSRSLSGTIHVDTAIIGGGFTLLII